MRNKYVKRESNVFFVHPNRQNNCWLSTFLQNHR